MYETPVSHISGFSFIGHVRSFDNKYWRIASVTSEPGYLWNYYLEEFKMAEGHTKRRLKVPVTDAVTIMAWSDLRYYKEKWKDSRLHPMLRGFNARRECVLELSKVIRRVIGELIQNGAQEVQLDIPAATQYQSVEDIRLVAEAFNETTKGLSAKFSVHSCFPPRCGYHALFPYILEMKKCMRFSFEYANGDGFRRGLTEGSRPGYSELKLFREYGWSEELGVGVVNVHTDRLPSVGTVSDRALYAAKVTELDPSKLYVSPDCGLRTRRPEVAYSMLSLVVAGAARARKEVEGS
jgi:5-methyltetrahydropteroyltriglutamate--homocysteine methyltransferase